MVLNWQSNEAVTMAKTKSSLGCLVIDPKVEESPKDISYILWRLTKNQQDNQRKLVIEDMNIRP